MEKTSCRYMVCLWRNHQPSPQVQDSGNKMWTVGQTRHGYQRCINEFNVKAEKVKCCDD